MSNQANFQPIGPQGQDPTQHSFEFAKAPQYRLQPYSHTSQVSLLGQDYLLEVYVCPVSRLVLSYRLSRSD